LVVFERLHVVRVALWAADEPQLQEAWRDQFEREQDLPWFDPDAPH
jgi:hypothetical protein